MFRLLCALAVTVLAQTAVWGGTSGVRTQSRTLGVGGRSYRVKIAQASLSDYRVVVALAHDKVGSTSSLGGIAGGRGAQAGINGCFFNAYTSSSYKTPYMNLVTNGVVRYSSNIGVTLGFDSRGDYRMEHPVFSESQQKVVRAESPGFWADAQEALGCGPLLVKDGVISVNPAAEGFRQDKIVSLRARRSAVGITRDRHILLVTCDTAGIRELAAVMQELGAVDAMNLDGGGSSALWANGRYLAGPGRAISNALLLVPAGEAQAKTSWIDLAGAPLPEDEARRMTDVLSANPLLRQCYSALLSSSRRGDVSTADSLLDRSYIRQNDHARLTRGQVLMACRSGAAAGSSLGAFYLQRIQPYGSGSRIAVTGVCSARIPGEESGAPPMLFEHVWRVDPQRKSCTLVYERVKDGNGALADSIHAWPRELVITGGAGDVAIGTASRVQIH